MNPEVMFRSAKISLATLALALPLAPTAHAEAAAAPDVAQLKQAAEAGDAKAQCDYAGRLWFTNRDAAFALMLKSANQGYGPAEDVVGRNYASATSVDPKKDRATLDRLAVKFLSRAAYKNIAGSQAALARYFDKGIVVTKDQTKAYAWAMLAVKNGEGTTMAGSYQKSLDSLVERLMPDVIAAGDKLVAEFKPIEKGLNPIEFDLAVAQLKVTALNAAAARKTVAVNKVVFAEGETKSVAAGDDNVNLTCVAIEAGAAKFKLGDREFTLTPPSA